MTLYPCLVVVIPDGKAVVLFDGVCNLCDASVRFILARDRSAHFLFAANQSAAGRALLSRLHIASDPESSANSIFLVENGRIHERSTAVLRIARRLSFPWPLAYAFVVVPRFLRDAVYRYIAARRYRWFGKKDSCRVPTPDEAQRFLVDEPSA